MPRKQETVCHSGDDTLFHRFLSFACGLRCCSVSTHTQSSSNHWACHHPTPNPPLLLATKTPIRSLSLSPVPPLSLYCLHHSSFTSLPLPPTRPFARFVRRFALRRVPSSPSPKQGCRATAPPHSPNTHTVHRSPPHTLNTQYVSHNSPPSPPSPSSFCVVQQPLLLVRRHRVPAVVPPAPALVVLGQNLHKARYLYMCVYTCTGIRMADGGFRSEKRMGH